jgi:hypothetical protein
VAYDVRGLEAGCQSLDRADGTPVETTEEDLNVDGCDFLVFSSPEMFKAHKLRKIAERLFHGPNLQSSINIIFVLLEVDNRMIIV